MLTKPTNSTLITALLLLTILLTACRNNPPQSDTPCPATQTTSCPDLTPTITTTPTLLPPTPIAAIPTTSPPTHTPTPTTTPTQTPTPSPSPTITLIPITIEPNDNITYDTVFIPAGTFMMGNAAGHSDEQPVHEVYLDDFSLGKTEVTNEMFAAFVAATGYQTTAEQRGSAFVFADATWVVVPDAYWAAPTGPDSNIEGLANYPVIHISWYDAHAYCQWVGGRLPTEAEWEKAARGPESFLYPWGNQFDGHNLNYCDAQCNTTWSDTTIDDGYPQIAPVGHYPAGASPYGALDMAGNVWEWVADWYDSQYYDHSPPDNPLGPPTANYKILRGGAWDDQPAYTRTTFRDWSAPTNANATTSFRCAIPTPRPTHP
ncbi:MAG TPA: formylglycine-generating enzyme family protein [Anaerolineae bacterium]|nr:formylglycine-generating enzyme family protein [Anaerolineae bacterium]